MGAVVGLLVALFLKRQAVLSPLPSSTPHPMKEKLESAPCTASHRLSCRSLLSFEQPPAQPQVKGH